MQVFQKTIASKQLSYGAQHFLKCSKYNADFKYAAQTCKHVFSFHVSSIEQVVWPLFGQVSSYSRL